MNYSKLAQNQVPSKKNQFANGVSNLFYVSFSAVIASSVGAVLIGADLFALTDPLIAGEAIEGIIASFVVLSGAAVGTKLSRDEATKILYREDLKKYPPTNNFSKSEKSNLRSKERSLSLKIETVPSNSVTQHQRNLNKEKDTKARSKKVLSFKQLIKNGQRLTKSSENSRKK